MSGRLGWQFHVEDRGFRGGKVLYLGHLDAGFGRPFCRSVVAPFTTVRLEEGAAYDTPTLTESFEEVRDGVGDVTNFLQAAMDAAWEQGMRPKGFADHTSELKAVRYHLEDMRALAKVPARS